MSPQQGTADPRHDVMTSTGHTGSKQCSVIGRVAAVLLAVPDIDGDSDLIEGERPPPHRQDRVTGVASGTLSKSLVQGPAVTSREIRILVHGKVTPWAPGHDHVPHRIRSEASKKLLGASRIALSPLDETTQVRVQNCSELRPGDLVRTGDDSQCRGDPLRSAGKSEWCTLRIPDHNRLPQPPPQTELAHISSEVREGPPRGGRRDTKTRTIHGDKTHSERLNNACAESEPPARSRTRTQQNRRPVQGPPLCPAKHPPIRQSTLTQPGRNIGVSSHDQHHGHRFDVLHATFTMASNRANVV